jgi:hypothetical protein
MSSVSADAPSPSCKLCGSGFEFLATGGLAYDNGAMTLCRSAATRRCCVIGTSLALLLTIRAAEAAGNDAASPTRLAPTAQSKPPVNAAEPDPNDTASDSTQWSTADRPATIRLRDGTSITIAPNSRVSKLPMVTLSLGQKDAAPRVFSLELLSGTFDVEVAAEKRPSYGVLVHAPRKVGAIVKVGRATISTGRSGTTVAARSGQDMTVSVAEHWRSLRVGRSFSVTTAEPAGKQRQLLAAPTVRVDRPVVLGLGSDLTPQRLTWREIPGSQGYLLRLYRTNAEVSELVRELRTSRAESLVEGLTPGRYVARVAAVDSTGLESDQSSPIPLRIFEVSLPPEAFATPTAVVLPSDARIALLHAGDLEMSYGSGNAMFVAAPETVGLHDGKSVRIRFREKGSTLETQLQLEPLDIKPRILLEPSRAIWPGAPVSIRVSFRRSDGSLPPNEASFLAAVSVNARPISVKWQRSAGTMTTQVDKPPFAGPWVVRVMVHDPRGHVLARDFLEVAELPRNESALTSSP